MKQNTFIDHAVITAIASQGIKALSEQFPFQITAEAIDKKTAEIRISGAIHEWRNSADWFRSQIESFNDKGIEEVNLHITTPGGDVFQAAEIYNCISEFKGKVKGFGGVVVASAGTYIRLACDEFEMVPNGKWMFHKPEGGVRGNEDAWESKLKLLKSITDDYREGYADLLSLKAEDIEKKWSKGAVWLSAKEAEKEGWITAVSKKKAELTEKETALFTALGQRAPKAKQKSKLNTEIKMNLQTTALSLGLDENATEAEIKAEMARLRDAGKEVDRLKAEALQKEKAAKDNKIKAALDQAIADKKIKATQVDGLKKFAEADFESFEAHIKDLPSLEKISDNIQGKAGKTAAQLKDKKFNELTAQEKEQLLDEDPEAFQAKYEAYLEA